jgi:hypothetical protein
MGVELRITRAEFWAENDNAKISADEWQSYVASDAELKAWPANGRYFVRWLGSSQYDEPWLDWFEGNIVTKWPDTALYKKMLKIATALGAQVQDEEGTVYRTESEWEFDPKAAHPRLEDAQRPWWMRIF